MSEPMSEAKVPGLYECYAAKANDDLTEVQIFHNELVAWDDEDAVARFRRQHGGIYRDLNVRRIMDVPA